MKAITLSKKGDIKYCNVITPRLKKGFTKIKIISTGLCGSDIQKIVFDSLARKSLKTDILGHEFSGVIESIISNSIFKRGDRVAIVPIIFDKTFSIINSVSLGKEFPGGFAQYCLVPIKNLRKIPENISFDLAALADVVAVSLHGYNLSGKPRNKKTLVIGDGAIALSMAILLKTKKNEVFLLGKNTKNLHIATKLGIKPLTNLKRSDFFDFVFECVGRSQDNTLETSIKAIKSKGMIVVLGVFKKDYKTLLCLRNLFFKEAAIIGSNSYEVSPTRDDFSEALKFISQNKAKFSKLITHILPLKDFNKGLSLIKNRKETGAIKIIFHPQE